MTSNCPACGQHVFTLEEKKELLAAIQRMERRLEQYDAKEARKAKPSWFARLFLNDADKRDNRIGFRTETHNN